MEVEQPQLASRSPKPDPSPPTFAFRPQRQPMFWAALAYALGIVVGFYAWRPASWWIVACAAFVSGSAYFLQRRVWLAGSLALGALFLAETITGMTAIGSALTLAGVIGVIYVTSIGKQQPAEEIGS